MASVEPLNSQDLNENSLCKQNVESLRSSINGLVKKSITETEQRNYCCKAQEIARDIRDFLRRDKAYHQYYKQELLEPKELFVWLTVVSSLNSSDATVFSLIHELYCLCVNISVRCLSVFQLHDILDLISNCTNAHASAMALRALSEVVAWERPHSTPISRLCFADTNGVAFGRRARHDGQKFAEGGSLWTFDHQWPLDGYTFTALVTTNKTLLLSRSWAELATSEERYCLSRVSPRRFAVVSSKNADFNHHHFEKNQMPDFEICTLWSVLDTRDMKSVEILLRYSTNEFCDLIVKVRDQTGCMECLAVDARQLLDNKPSIADGAPFQENWHWVSVSHSPRTHSGKRNCPTLSIYIDGKPVYAGDELKYPVDVHRVLEEEEGPDVASGSAPLLVSLGGSRVHHVRDGENSFVCRWRWPYAGNIAKCCLLNTPNHSPAGARELHRQLTQTQDVSLRRALNKKVSAARSVALPSRRARHHRAGVSWLGCIEQLKRQSPQVVQVVDFCTMLQRVNDDPNRFLQTLSNPGPFIDFRPQVIIWWDASDARHEVADGQICWNSEGSIMESNEDGTCSQMEQWAITHVRNRLCLVNSVHLLESFNSIGGVSAIWKVVLSYPDSSKLHPLFSECMILWGGLVVADGLGFQRHFDALGMSSIGILAQMFKDGALLALRGYLRSVDKTSLDERSVFALWMLVDAILSVVLPLSSENSGDASKRITGNMNLEHSSPSEMNVCALSHNELKRLVAQAVDVLFDFGLWQSSKSTVRRCVFSAMNSVLCCFPPLSELGFITPLGLINNMHRYFGVDVGNNLSVWASRYQILELLNSAILGQSSPLSVQSTFATTWTRYAGASGPIVPLWTPSSNTEITTQKQSTSHIDSLISSVVERRGKEYSACLLEYLTSLLRRPESATAVLQWMENHDHLCLFWNLFEFCDETLAIILIRFFRMYTTATRSSHCKPGHAEMHFAHEDHDFRVLGDDSPKHNTLNKETQRQSTGKRFTFDTVYALKLLQVLSNPQSNMLWSRACHDSLMEFLLDCDGLVSNAGSPGDATSKVSEYSIQHPALLHVIFGLLAHKNCAKDVKRYALQQFSHLLQVSGALGVANCHKFTQIEGWQRWLCKVVAVCIHQKSATELDKCNPATSEAICALEVLSTVVFHGMTVLVPSTTERAGTKLSSFQDQSSPRHSRLVYSPLHTEKERLNQLPLALAYLDAALSGLGRSFCDELNGDAVEDDNGWQLMETELTLYFRTLFLCRIVSRGLQLLRIAAAGMGPPLGVVLQHNTNALEQICSCSADEILSSGASGFPSLFTRGYPLSSSGGGRKTSEYQTHSTNLWVSQKHMCTAMQELENVLLVFWDTLAESIERYRMQGIAVDSVPNGATFDKYRTYSLANPWRNGETSRVNSTRTTQQRWDGIENRADDHCATAIQKQRHRQELDRKFRKSVADWSRVLRTGELNSASALDLPSSIVSRLVDFPAPLPPGGIGWQMVLIAVSNIVGQVRSLNAQFLSEKPSGPEGPPSPSTTPILESIQNLRTYFDQFGWASSLTSPALRPSQSELKTGTSPPLLGANTSPPLLGANTSPPLLGANTSPPLLGTDASPQLTRASASDVKHRHTSNSVFLEDDLSSGWDMSGVPSPNIQQPYDTLLGSPFQPTSFSPSFSDFHVGRREGSPLGFFGALPPLSLPPAGPPSPSVANDAGTTVDPPRGARHRHRDSFVVIDEAGDVALGSSVGSVSVLSASRVHSPALGPSSVTGQAEVVLSDEDTKRAVYLVSVLAQHLLALNKLHEKVQNRAAAGETGFVKQASAASPSRGTASAALSRLSEEQQGKDAAGLGEVTRELQALMQHLAQLLAVSRPKPPSSADKALSAATRANSITDDFAMGGFSFESEHTLSGPKSGSECGSLNSYSNPFLTLDSPSSSATDREPERLEMRRVPSWGSSITALAKAQGYSAVGTRPKELRDSHLDAVLAADTVQVATQDVISSQSEFHRWLKAQRTSARRILADQAATRARDHEVQARRLATRTQAWDASSLEKELEQTLVMNLQQDQLNRCHAAWERTTRHVKLLSGAQPESKRWKVSDKESNLRKRMFLAHDETNAVYVSAEKSRMLKNDRLQAPSREANDDETDEAIPSTITKLSAIVRPRVQSEEVVQADIGAVDVEDLSLSGAEILRRQSSDSLDHSNGFNSSSSPKLKLPRRRSSSLGGIAKKLGNVEAPGSDWDVIEFTSVHYAAHNEQVQHSTECDLILPTRTMRGRLDITSSHLYFYGDTSQSPGPVDGRPQGIIKRWPLKNLQEIHRRRYLLRPSALEFFFANRTARLLHFSGGIAECVKVVRCIATQRVSQLKGFQLHNPMALVRLKHPEWTEKWVNGEMSNFEYLMRLNTAAGRSYNDLTQYPVFPWVLQDYHSPELDLSDPKVYRDLTKPIGALNPARLEQYRERWKAFVTCQSSADEKSIPPFLYGTHYSSLGSVLYYLIRLEPFTGCATALQQGKFDHADRLFHSIPETWTNCYKSPSDVKELTPEWFYLPSMFENLNNFDFGTRQDGTALGDVVLPPWARSAYEFVRLHRQALESDYVSANLHHWIDLIFGFKQRGEMAVKADNVFYYMTYEDAIDLNAIADPNERRAAEVQIANFGQTPSQLFTLPHPPRRLGVSPTVPLTVKCGVPGVVPGHVVPEEGGDDVAQLYWKSLAPQVPASNTLLAGPRVPVAAAAQVPGRPPQVQGVVGVNRWGEWFRGLVVTSGAGEQVSGQLTRPRPPHVAHRELVLRSRWGHAHERTPSFGHSESHTFDIFACQRLSLLLARGQVALHSGTHAEELLVACPMELGIAKLQVGGVEAPERIKPLGNQNANSVVVQRVKLHPGSGHVTCVSVDETGEVVATGCEDGSIVLWQVKVLGRQLIQFVEQMRGRARKSVKQHESGLVVPYSQTLACDLCVGGTNTTSARLCNKCLSDHETVHGPSTATSHSSGTGFGRDAPIRVGKGFMEPAPIATHHNGEVYGANGLKQANMDVSNGPTLARSVASSLLNKLRRALPGSKSTESAQQEEFISSRPQRWFTQCHRSPVSCIVLSTDLDLMASCAWREPQVVIHSLHSGDLETVVKIRSCLSESNTSEAVSCLVLGDGILIAQSVKYQLQEPEYEVTSCSLNSFTLEGREITQRIRAKGSVPYSWMFVAPAGRSPAVLIGITSQKVEICDLDTLDLEHVLIEFQNETIESCDLVADAQQIVLVLSTGDIKTLNIS